MEGLGRDKTILRGMKKGQTFLSTPRYITTLCHQAPQSIITAQFRSLAVAVVKYVGQYLLKH